MKLHKLDIAILGDQIGFVITEFLNEHPLLFPKPNPKSRSQQVKPCPSTMSELKKLKKAIRKQLNTPSFWHSLPFYTSNLSADLWACCKAISDVKKQEAKKLEAKTVSFQEKMFNKNKVYPL